MSRNDSKTMRRQSDSGKSDTPGGDPDARGSEREAWGIVVTGLPSLPIHSTPTETPTPTPGIEAVSGEIVSLGIVVIMLSALFIAAVVWLHTVTGGRVP